MTDPLLLAAEAERLAGVSAPAFLARAPTLLAELAAAVRELFDTLEWARHDETTTLALAAHELHKGEHANVARMLDVIAIRRGSLQCSHTSASPDEYGAIQCPRTAISRFGFCGEHSRRSPR